MATTMAIDGAGAPYPVNLEVPYPQELSRGTRFDEYDDTYRFVAFRVRAEKEGDWPTVFSPFFLRLHDCQDDGYSPETVSDGFEFKFWWRGGDDEGEVVFPIAQGREPCDLIYHSGLGEVEFFFP